MANGQLTSCAQRLHALANEILELHLQYSVKLGVNGLIALGMNAADAADVVSKWDALATPMQVYYGLVGQASPYNFNDALAPCRGGTTA
jgi:hypothetical protein